DPIGINTVDTDGDGLTDCEELTGIDDPSTPGVPNGPSDPNDPCDPIGINTVDTDGDGLTDCEELTGIDDPSTPLVPSGTSDPDDPCSPRPCDLEIPEGFTPNGDNFNDLFVIPNIGNYPGNEIIIFNRWGNQVFEMVEYDNLWDGTRNVGTDITGDQLPTGTYYYILDTKDETIGDKGIFQGFIYLKR
ncbi:MAG: gliding motility-associated C-terminal domain-containing protein, partial [Crocinitomicaceae bacterium]